MLNDDFQNPFFGLTLLGDEIADNFDLLLGRSTAYCFGEGGGALFLCFRTVTSLPLTQGSLAASTSWNKFAHEFSPYLAP